MTLLAEYPLETCDIVSLRGRLRPADKREWFGGGADWETQLWHAYALRGEEGYKTWVLRDVYGTCLAVYGVRPTDVPGVGQAFFVAAQDAMPHWRSIQRRGAAILLRMLQAYPRIIAWTHHANTVHHRWMETMGFHFLGQGRIEPFWVPYRMYDMRAPRKEVT